MKARTKNDRHYSSLRRSNGVVLWQVERIQMRLLPIRVTGVARSSSRSRRLRSPRSRLHGPDRNPPRCRAGRFNQCNARSLGGAPPTTLGLSRPLQAAMWGVPGQLAAGRPRFLARVSSARGLSNINMYMHRSPRVGCASISQYNETRQQTEKTYKRRHTTTHRMRGGQSLKQMRAPGLYHVC